MNFGLRNLFTVVILSCGLFFEVPVAIANTEATAALSSDECDAPSESASAVQSEPEGKQEPLRVNFDKALHCLTMNIYHESRSESRAGQIAVASVTLNRVKSKKFPETVCGVVKQGGQKRRNRCQFSWWCDGKDDKPTNNKAWNRAMEIGRLSLLGIIDDPTGGALYYHADYVQPNWSRVFERSARIGKHLFYKPTKRLRTAASD